MMPISALTIKTINNKGKNIGLNNQYNNVRKGFQKKYWNFPLRFGEAPDFPLRK